jgi:hypothetical protein
MPRDARQPRLPAPDGGPAPSDSATFGTRPQQNPFNIHGYKPAQTGITLMRPYAIGCLRGCAHINKPQVNL